MPDTMHALRSAVTVVFLALLGLAAIGPRSRAADPPPPAAKPVPAKPTAHETRTIEGWTVRVDRRLLEGPDAEVGRKALDLLAHRLHEIAFVLSEDRVRALREIVVQIDLTHGKLVPMQYHPSREWLVGNDYAPELAKCVHIPRADQFASRRHHLEQPWCVLHELAHAYHDQVLGFDHPEVRALWKAFAEDERWKKTLLHDGRNVRHYALTNEKEFFAEMSEAYVGTNDFFPFHRAELKRELPATWELLKTVWGPMP
jgi:hypothetical protein